MHSQWIVRCGGSGRSTHAVNGSTQYSAAHAQSNVRLAPDAPDRSLKRPWSELSEADRELSRKRVDGIVADLDALGLDLVPLRRWGAPEVELTDQEVDLLAARDHQRWFDDRTAAGWTHGDVRDDEAKRNPLLVDWGELPDDARAFNRSTARELLPMLARNGFEAARRRGSQVHDPIHYDESKKHTHTLGYERPTNNAGGLEAGMTNGQTLVIRAAKKPISTLRKPLASINLDTKEAEGASYERSDVCAISAASVIVENVVAIEIAAALVDKFGGDSVAEMKARYELFLKMASER